MKTFLIVLVMMATANGDEDLYIIKDPSFSSNQQCIMSVQANYDMLVKKASTAYDGRNVMDIFCVEQKKLTFLMQEV